MHHHYACAAERAVAERDGCGEIGVNGGKQSQILQPGLQRLAAGTD
jgi:hypothetical protein